MGIGTGRNNIVVAVPQALPKPPDVVKEGEVPGGVLLPCTLAGKPAGGLQSLIPLTFEGVRATIDRVALSLPVFLQENGTEEVTGEKTVKTHYNTLKLAKEATEALPPIPIEEEDATLATPNQRFEHNESKIFYALEEATWDVVVATDITQHLGVLPITVTVIARIVGPEGPLWSQSFDVPLRYVKGIAGGAIGAGVLEAYADLTNPLPIDCERKYSLQLLIFVPTATKPNVQLGLTSAAAAGNGSATVYYNFETGPPSK